ncbi:response regulator transcription factor [Flavobacterium sp. CYK-55]|uniref:LytR/AlgR family response regulator transcription factor n=1 Tax=Flavobacterium sp. CYK-55 TaxID=2835529 RepID=UPI001BCD5D3D|nr:LytTR family DNA-binding domain-containing protein [Flavobacterium sp. CYK-55]MBS7786204.1 response regulator transcription factor [Flavobacterium sp. CYK-55]
MKTIIVDDEPKARSILHNLITEHCKGIEIVGQAQNIKEAVKLINSQTVELVFLDVEMPNENGFALFDYFERPTFETIFCTAYSAYALNAFEVSAIDYLLKPVSISKLQNAIEKAIKSRGQNQILERVNALRDNITVNQLQKIALPLSDGLFFIKVEDILYFEADGSYTYVITLKDKYMVSKKIKEFNDLLENDHRFYRVHRSYLVNIQQIKKYSKKDGANLVFENNQSIPVAREKRSDFDQYIGNLSV